MDGLKARLSFDAVAYDYDDEYLTIDTDTHTININNVSRLFGVQYDGNSKLIKFRIRNKLSDIQKMQDSIVYINWIDSKGVKGQSIAINKTISNDICEFAWKVPFDALKNSGVLHFAMNAVVTKNSSSVIDQRWSTQIASVITPDGIYIKSYTPSSEEEDRIAQIYNELSNMINKQNDNLQSQVNSLNEILDAYILKDYNLSRMKKIENSYITAGTGALINTQGWTSSDYITLPNNSLSINMLNTPTTENIYNAFYDSNYNFIQSFNAMNNVKIPTNAKYIRLSFRKEIYDKITFNIITVYDDLLLALNTIRLQGEFNLKEFNADKSIDLYIKPNISNNIGYYREFSYTTNKYFGCSKHGELINDQYKFNIPRYSALVIDLYSQFNVSKAQIEIKSYNDISKYDIILLANNIGYVDEVSGILARLKNRIEKRNDDKVLKAICRFGELYGQPESVSAMISSQKAGFNYFRVNLQCTSDDFFVLWHDIYLNQNTKNVYDGDILVPYSDTSRIKISETTFSELNKFKYGRASYESGIPTLEDMLKACRSVGMNLYLESKGEFSQEQITKLINLINKYGMARNTSVSLSTNANAIEFSNQLPSIRVGIQAQAFTDDVKNTLTTLSNKSSKVYWWGWNTMDLTADITAFLSKHNVEFECGDFTTYEQVDLYLAKENNMYCTGVELQGLISPLIGNYLSNKYLVN